MTQETKIQLVDAANVFPLKIKGNDNVQTIVPIGMVIIQFAASTNQEVPVPCQEGHQFLGFSPEKARQVAEALLKAASHLEKFH